MLNMEKIISIFEKPGETKNFTPTEVDLSDPFIPAHKDQEDILDTVSIPSGTLKLNKIDTNVPFSKTVVAIDSTAFTLGTVQDGIIGATRISVIIRKKGQVDHIMDRYGPYIFMITNQNKQSIYQQLFEAVYGSPTNASLTPETQKMIDRVRNLMERLVQLETIRSYQDSLILLDGSLIGNTIANPAYHIDRMMNESYKNGNGLAAISKFTNLTLGANGRSILSLYENQVAPGFMGPINNFVDGNNSRYMGEIYVSKLTKSGEIFRIDIPSTLPIPPQKIFESLSSISSDYGYPEELKLAHSTSIFSSIEILELQAAAINEFGMEIQEDLRKKLFAPF